MSLRTRPVSSVVQEVQPRRARLPVPPWVNVLPVVWACVISARVVAEPPLPPTAAAAMDEHAAQVHLARGIIAYHAGTDLTWSPAGDPPKELLEALEHFDYAVGHPETDRPARFMRGLTHGLLALKAQQVAEILRGEHRALEARRDYRDNAGYRRLVDVHLQSLRDEVEAKTARGVDPAETDRLRYQIRVIETQHGTLGEAVPIGDLASGEKTETTARFDELAFDRFAKMRDDLDWLMRDSDAAAILQLVDAVMLTKQARLLEEKALRLVKAREDAGEVRAEARRTLSNPGGGEIPAGALEVLDAYLQGADVEPLNVTRARFYRSVIMFRLAVPRRGENEDLKGQSGAASDLLRRAEDDLSSLASEIPSMEMSRPEAMRWLSYCQLYLGLVLTEQAKLSSNRITREAALDRAVKHLGDAQLSDASWVEEEGAGAAGVPASKSLSGELIPELVAKQLLHISQARRVESPQPRNDWELAWSFGAAFDTNVVLLGERTDLARNLDDESDFAFDASTSLTYTGDLALLSPKLDRWTIGASVRANSVWNTDISSFDLEDYGLSLAVQYAFPVPSNPKFWGRSSASLRYDGDYLELGHEKFVSADAITANLRVYNGNERAWTDLFYRFDTRDYNEPLRDIRLDRDGVYSRIGISSNYKLVDVTPSFASRNWEPWGHKNDDDQSQIDPDYPKRYIVVRGLASYGWDATEGDEFDLKLFTLETGVDVPLPHGWVLATDAEFEWQDYAHGSLIDYHRRGRQDFIGRYGVGLKRLFVLSRGDASTAFKPAFGRLTMSVEIGANWTVDDSNVVDRLGEAIFEYDRAVYGFVLRFAFN